MTCLVLFWEPPQTKEHTLEVDQGDSWQSTRKVYCIVLPLEARGSVPFDFGLEYQTVHILWHRRLIKRTKRWADNPLCCSSICCQHDVTERQIDFCTSKEQSGTEWVLKTFQYLILLGFQFHNYNVLHIDYQWTTKLEVKKTMTASLHTVPANVALLFNIINTFCSICTRNCDELVSPYVLFLMRKWFLPGQLVAAWIWRSNSTQSTNTKYVNYYLQMLELWQFSEDIFTLSRSE